MLDVLQAAEHHRKSVIDAALLQATQAMNDIAHLSPGEVERLIEQQALDLNLSMLDNRCAASAQHELTMFSLLRRGCKMGTMILNQLGEFTPEW